MSYGGNWVRSSTASKFYGVHANTLRRWPTDGNIEFKTTVGGQRLYLLPSETTSKKEKPSKETVMYVRVSSGKQKDYLERQITFVSSRFPCDRIVRDVGSGLNFKRRGLIKLLEEVDKGSIRRVVVASKDRLCRFGFELIKWFLERENVELLVLDKIDKTPEQEFTEDILAILQVFACGEQSVRKRTYAIKKQEDQAPTDLDTN